VPIDAADTPDAADAIQTPAGVHQDLTRRMRQATKAAPGPKTGAQRPKQGGPPGQPKPQGQPEGQEAANKPPDSAAAAPQEPQQPKTYASSPIFNALEIPLLGLTPETGWEIGRAAVSGWSALMNPATRHSILSTLGADQMRSRLLSQVLGKFADAGQPAEQMQRNKDAMMQGGGGHAGITGPVTRGQQRQENMVQALQSLWDGAIQAAQAPAPQFPTVLDLRSVLEPLSTTIENAAGTAFEAPFKAFGEMFYQPPDPSWPQNFADLTPDQANVWWGQFGLAGTPGTVGGEVAGVARAAKMTQAGAAIVQRARATQAAGRAVAWAGIAPVLAVGKKLPGSDLAVDHFLPGFARALVKVNQDVEVADTTARLRHAEAPVDSSGNAVDDALTIPPVTTGGVVAKGGKPTATLETVKLPGGEIVTFNRLPKAEQAKLLQRFGVHTIEDLAAKLAGGGGLNSKQVDWLVQNWRKYSPYDLTWAQRTERPLRDPREVISELDDPLKPQGQAYMAQTHLLLSDLLQGPFRSDRALGGSLIRSLLGLNRALDKRFRDWQTSMAALVGDEKGVGEEERKALEGDLAAYRALPPQRKLVVDTQRMLDAALRKQEVQWEYRTGHLPNYFARRPVATPKRVPVTGGRRALSTGPRKSRTVDFQVNPKTGELELNQRFATTEEANQALLASREETARQLQMPVEEGGEGLSAEAARAEAEARYPLFETNYYRVSPQDLKRRIDALHSHQAVFQWSNTFIRHQAGEAGTAVRAAYRGGMPSRQREYLVKTMGYKTLDASGFRDVLWHPSVAKNLQTVMDRLKTPESAGLAKLARNVERWAVKNIMYSPMIHSMNMAGRMGWYWTANPLAFTQQLLHTIKADHQPLSDRLLEHGLREDEAHQAGVLPPASFKRGGTEYFRGPSLATGDQDIGSFPGKTTLEDAPQNLKQSQTASLLGLGQPQGWYSHLNQTMWNGIHNFQVAVYHVEKQKALHAGIDETRARLWAADRANAWGGHVRPENWDAHLHELSRSVFFAPNWWRSFGALLTGKYDQTGIFQDRAMSLFVAGNEVRTLMAMFMFQKVADNALNLALSGHPQWENQPGNQDRLELDHLFPVDPNTGAHQTLEPFLTRQTYALETAAGLENPQSTAYGFQHYRAEDVPGGLMREVAARFSPLLDALAAAGNIDVYQSIKNGNWYRVNPKDGAFEPGGAQLLTALSDLIPGGMSYQIEHLAQQGAGAAEALGLPGTQGTTVPKNLKSAVGSTASRLLLNLVLGINPPYPYAPKSEGKPLSQDDYARVAQQHQQYMSTLQTLSQDTLTGAITPNEFLYGKNGHGGYFQLSDAYHGFLNGIFDKSPYYTQGALGMLHDWEALYPQATDATGALDVVKLQQLQSDFEQKHSLAEMQAMHSALNKTEAAVPMLKIYHDTVSAYHDFQTQEAARLGIPLAELQQQASEYGALYGNLPQSRKFLGQHIQLAEYEAAKRRWEVSTYPGLVYGMLYDSSVVMRWLNAHGMSESQILERAATAEQSGGG
jgi:hypothetical protein